MNILCSWLKIIASGTRAGQDCIPLPRLAEVHMYERSPCVHSRRISRPNYFVFLGNIKTLSPIFLI